MHAKFKLTALALLTSSALFGCNHGSENSTPTPKAPEAKIEKGISKAKVEKAEADLNAKIAEINKAEANLNAKINKVDSKVDSKVEKVEANLNAKIDKVDSKIEKAEANLYAKIKKATATPAILVGNALSDQATSAECEEAVFAHAQDNSDTKITWGTPVYTGWGTYSRIKKVKMDAAGTTALLMVFSDGPFIQTRMSHDGGKTWGEQNIAAIPQGHYNADVAVVETDNLWIHPGDIINPNMKDKLFNHPDGTPGADKVLLNYTNADFVELDNGDWIISFNARPFGGEVVRPIAPAHPEFNFDIRTITSKDKGKTWSKAKIVYAGGNQLEKGVWEPVILQIPHTGIAGKPNHLQMYFADEFEYKDGRQQISMLTSTDNGKTWTEKPKRVSFRDNNRDGMPVPIILNNGDIAISIEDMGIGTNFKPAIIRTSANGEWDNAPVLGNSQDRNRALADISQLPNDGKAGGPYLDQFPSGETIISVYSAQCRTRSRHDILHNSTMRVYLGSDDARDFTAGSTPFGENLVPQGVAMVNGKESPTGGKALWGSVLVLSDTKVLATASIESNDPAEFDKRGIWVVEGTITRK